MKLVSSFLFQSLSLAALSTLVFCNSAQAQVSPDVKPDNSLGNNSSTVNTNGNLDRIENGLTRGSNLFHSFEKLNVSNGRGVFFINPNGINNIFARVTGGNISNINGFLGVVNPAFNNVGNANLYLINPTGIIFGPNSRLLLGGSFYGSTADSVVFDNKFEFSASAKNVPPLLTVNIPVGLKFRDNPGNITNSSKVRVVNGVVVRGLEVMPGKTLALIGGDVNLDGGTLSAPGGRIELGGLTKPGTVTIKNDGSLTFPTAIQRGDVSLKDASLVSVLSNGGGDISINSRNLNLSESSTIRAGIQNSNSNQLRKGGNINIHATDSITLNGTSGTQASTRIANIVYDYGISGDIIINTRDLKIINNAQIGSAVAPLLTPIAIGLAGKVNITASNDVFISGIDSGILSSVAKNSYGNGSNIKIDANSIYLENNAQIQAVNFGFLLNESLGNSGNIELNAKNKISLNNALISTTFLGVGDGKSGFISLNAGEKINIQDTLINSIGKGGFISIGVKLNEDSLIPKTVSIEKSSISTSNPNSSQAGYIAIDAKNEVSIRNSNSKDKKLNRPLGIESKGKEGIIFIGFRTTPKVVNLENSTITTTNENVMTNIDDEINAGFVAINASEKVNLSQRSEIQTFTNRRGNAGSVFIDAKGGNVVFSGASTVNTSTSVFGNGLAGNILVKGNNLFLYDGSQILSQTYGKGNAGSIFVTVKDTVFLSGNIGGFSSSGLFTTTEEGAEGLGGLISVNASKLIISDGAVLNARSRSKFSGGNIFVKVDDLQLLNGGQILATAFNGGGAGNITIEADTIKIFGIDSTYTDRFEQIKKIFGEELANSIFDTVSANSGIFVNSINDQNKPLGVQTFKVADVTTQSGKGGSLKITANSLTMSQGVISAESEFADGGNINIDLKDYLFIKNGSLISAKANGNGGNIFINQTPGYNGFIIATPNGDNDIIADSFGGNGGVIKITTDGNFGFAVRNEANIIDLKNNNSNDISARSLTNPNLNGNVTISTPQTDPTKGITELPEQVTDASTQLAQSFCAKGRGSQFIIVGKGGLAENPTEMLTSDNVRVGLAETVANTTNADSNNTLPKKDVSSKDIVPARGWVMNEKGEVVLTAYDPTQSLPEREQKALAMCSPR
ncbi:two-partner secretion domain-containing protein [Calothrix sp. 336/3]|uniref:two-partner secretion domain-containing protein n=1 Tax=Calothrix sp. 336/3 TaxID=1337936 RepID=UPI00054E1744|nr:filamentous hemagglutinin N-terminal domain-containing protein [Calothrix sp. 336/3]